MQALVDKTWRYALVGVGVSLLYSLLIIALVDGLDANPTVASVLAFMVIVPLSYVGQRQFTFRDAGRVSFQRLRFGLMATSSFLAAAGAMYLVTEILHWSYLIGILLNWLIIPAINFFVNLVWVFPADPLASHRATEGGDA
jgi:putative flippase GtrA